MTLRIMRSTSFWDEIAGIRCEGVIENNEAKVLRVEGMRGTLQITETNCEYRK